MPSMNCRASLLFSIVSIAAGCAAVAAPAFAGGDLAVTVPSPLSPQQSMFDGAAVTLTLDQAVMTSLKPARRALIENFPLGPNLNVTLDLKAIDAFAPDAKIVTATLNGRGKAVEQPLTKPDVILLGGSVAGVADSQAFLSLSNSAQHGWVRVGGRTFILSSGPFGAHMPAMIYDTKALPEGAITLADVRCHADELAPLINEPAPDDAAQGGGGDGGAEGGLAGPGAPPCREVRIAFDTDYEFLAAKFGGDVIAAATYAATMMAATNQIYTTDINTRLQISFLRLWTTPNDPWTMAGSGDQLGEFRTYWQANQAGTPRTLAHLVSARGLGGGVAWVSVMCNTTYGYAVSGNINGYFPYPIQSNNSQNWDLMVFAHETGHNFSSPHTHNYVPPIDGCGNTPNDCTLAAQGTIMSYCHLCSGGVANIALTLHPTVNAYILNYLNGLSCSFVGSSLQPVAQDDRGYVVEGGSLALDVLKNDLETNCDSVTINSFGAASANGGSVALSAGTGPGGRDQLTYTAPSGTGFNGIDTFTYSIRDAANQISNATVSIRVYGFRATDNPIRFQSGSKARYYSLTAPAALPNFATLVPYATNTAGVINFPSTNGNFAGSGIADNVGAAYSGWLTVPTTGLYTLYLESDDGSRLLVGDEVIVANDGLHGMVERSGLIGLTAGKHRIRIEFFEAGSGAGLIARYSGPGVAKQVIPAGNWSRAVAGDVNESGGVDVADLLQVISAWGPCTAGCNADTNNDGQISVTDLLTVISNWG